jgi:LytS/YehU family sensor histidine kinase
VENAIKHGASTVGHSYLTVSITVEQNKIHFHSENSKPAVKAKMPGGLGLVNIKRRLELIYPGNHKLDIEDKTETYTVNLTIPL